MAKSIDISIIFIDLLLGIKTSIIKKKTIYYQTKFFC